MKKSTGIEVNHIVYNFLLSSFAFLSTPYIIPIPAINSQVLKYINFLTTKNVKCELINQKALILVMDFSKTDVNYFMLSDLFLSLPIKESLYFMYKGVVTSGIVHNVFTANDIFINTPKPEGPLELSQLRETKLLESFLSTVSNQELENCITAVAETNKTRIVVKAHTQST